MPSRFLTVIKYIVSAFKRFTIVIDVPPLSPVFTESTNRKPDNRALISFVLLFNERICTLFNIHVGTPVTVVESGYVSALGWNQYGGWRIGISSFDGKRYYYYAHLRQNRPYAEGLKEGAVVTAGDVIGYMGRTGYSTTENVNNIDVYHLHIGMQLIFDESQREGVHEIWIDLYPLVCFLSGNQSETVRNDETKEWVRKYRMKDPAVKAYQMKGDLKKMQSKKKESKTRESKKNTAETLCIAG